MKALFLVKYYDQFKPTLHNITILMLERFDVNLPQLKEKIKEALNILVTRNLHSAKMEICMNFLLKKKKT